MHSTRLASALALAATLGLVGSVRAGTYSSPLLSSPIGGTAQCRISNVGTGPVNVAGTMINNIAAPLAPLVNTCVDLYAGVLPAGHSCTITVGSTSARCVVDASSSKVRVVVVILDGGGNIVATEPATKK